MNVGSAVATWLKGLRLLYDDECEGPTDDSSQVTLSQSATAYFANGVRVALLLRALSHDGELSLDTIKELHTPVARLYNWNVLIPILHAMGVDVDADMKVLIVAGDLDIVADVLEQLHGSGTGSGAAKRQGGQGMQQPRAAKDTTSVAQFLAFCCSEQLGCSWDQAVELARAPGHKALAKQQGLGVRGEHSSAVRWFKLVFAHCKHLGALCAGDASEAELALSAMRGGLGSFSPDVVLWCSRLLCRLAADLAHRGTQADTLWAFFSRPNGGAAMLLDAWRCGHSLPLAAATASITYGHSLHPAAAPAAYGCCLRHLRVQPAPPTLAACTAYACSLRHPRVQPPPPTLAGCTPSCGPTACCCRWCSISAASTSTASSRTCCRATCPRPGSTGASR